MLKFPQTSWIGIIKRVKKERVDFPIVFVVLEALSVQFLRYFYRCCTTIKYGRTRHAVHFLKRTFQRFTSKTLQKLEKISTYSRFFAACVYFLNCFGVTIMANLQEKLNSFGRLLKKYLQTSVGNCLKLDRK